MAEWEKVTLEADASREDVQHDPRPPRRSPAAQAARDNMGLLIIVAVVVVCALVFILQNRERVAVTFLSVDIQAPVWLFVVGFFVLGAVVWGVIGALRRRDRAR